MRTFCISILLLLLFPTAPTLFGQTVTSEKPILCTNQTAVKGKYQTLSISSGVEVQFRLKIKPKYRTDENYIAIAEEFREKYCRAVGLRIFYFKDKEQWRMHPLDLEATPLAVFFTGKNTPEKEVLAVYTIVNGKVETRNLEIDP